MPPSARKMFKDCYKSTEPNHRLTHLSPEALQSQKALASLPINIYTFPQSRAPYILMHKLALSDGDETG